LIQIMPPGARCAHCSGYERRDANVFAIGRGAGGSSRTERQRGVRDRARPTPRQVASTNLAIADKLRQAAVLLAAQGADAFRVAAYRRGADSILDLDLDLGVIAEGGGRKSLEAVPGIGRSLAAAIAEMLVTGRWSFLDHLKGAASPEMLFRSVPGVGPALARRLCDTLHIGTLEALEAAACDGRLEQVPGFGHRRIAMTRAGLASLLARVRRPPPLRSEEPTVGTLLDVDREYREKAAAGELLKIAPKRFNPRGEAWLPVLHTTRGPWQLTALYSNTARAHQLDRLSDWVVIFSHRDNTAEGQRTIVTETRGGAAGKRVVRGREAERSRHDGLM
jgi:hypothetical protein